MKIVAVGDVSFRDGDKENTKKTFKNIKAQSPNLVLALGDLFFTKRTTPIFIVIHRVH